MGYAGCKWNYVTDSKRKSTTRIPSPPIQVMETREGTQSNQHPGPQLPHPSTERQAVWPINPDQRALPEGTASRRENTPASMNATDLGQWGLTVQPRHRLGFGVYAQPASAVSRASLVRQ